ncbi:HigA family addiction module antidote protein, partial [bacterium]|nr:HigA family addiction module antidote protein [bacterium]
MAIILRLFRLKRSANIMKTNENKKYDSLHSNLPIPPGEYLEEVIEELGMNKDDLARRLERPASKLSAIFKGEKAITPDTALRLEKVVGVPAHIWTGLETEYRLTLARLEEKQHEERLQTETKMVSKFCYSELVKIGEVKKYCKPIDRVRELLRFFGTVSLTTVPTLRRYQPAFRKGNAGGESPEALAAWIRVGERRAAQAECKPFSKDKLKNTLDSIRQF